MIKVEPPEGDPVRTMGKHVDGKSLYAASILRNKRLVALDLRKPDARNVVRTLAAPRFVGAIDRVHNQDAPDPVLGSIAMPAPAPRLSGTPGEVRHAGGDVCADTVEVLRTIAHYRAHERR